ncbi:hypothetical protein Syun_015805 [Stephania yunnanensis]|uniref:Uncharacterized protein n=1 Tax=Stephania yunnanensis TaxID=152371 RepID=A0AAP0JMQ2_9MAGN
MFDWNDDEEQIMVMLLVLPLLLKGTEWNNYREIYSLHTLPITFSRFSVRQINPNWLQMLL